MGNKPPPSVYSIVEKAYFRLQAGDVITHCLEDGSTDPLHQMIQEMVIAGPQNLDGLREILDEAMKRKAQVYDDLNQVINQLMIILKGYGINLDNMVGNQEIQSMSVQQLTEMLDEQGIIDYEARSSILQVHMDSQELISTLVQKTQLLENIETYLQDWLWGLTYQFIRHGDDKNAEERNDLQ
jgi:uncharacterized protein YidB (DUF937 family)